MIPASAPLIDERTAMDVVEELQTLLRVYAPAWHEEVDPTQGIPGVSNALINVTARFAEIIIQRLNQVPQKNFLAFLNLLGAALLPPEPARVPVTFSLAKSALADVVVPAGTQVAAPPAAGEKDPVIFETEKELVVTAAQLAFLYLRDPQEDSYADYHGLAAPDADGVERIPIFHGNRRFDHILYLADNQLLNLSGIATLDLTLILAPGSGFNASEAPRWKDIVAWETWDGTQWTLQPPTVVNSSKTADNLPQVSVSFGAVPARPATSVNGISMQWIRGRLLPPITPDPAGRDGMLALQQLPQVMAVAMKARVARPQGLPLEAAFTNQLPIDLTKDFYPFGEKPKFNDVFWLALDEAFSHPGASVTLVVELTHEISALAAPPTLSWEVLIGNTWQQLGTSNPREGAKSIKASGFKDDTRAFTVKGPANVTLTLPSGPDAIRPATINGIQKYWLRVRLQSGNYGTEATYKTVPVPVPVLDKTTGKPIIDPKTNQPQTIDGVAYQFQAATFNPPSIKSISVQYSFDQTARPARILAYNDLRFTDVTGSNQAPDDPNKPLKVSAVGTSFAPFTISADLRPTLYFGFVLPSDLNVFPNETASIFFCAGALTYGEKTVPLWPDISREAADPSATVTHKFFVTNSGTTAADFTISILGTQWKLLGDPPKPAAVASPANPPIPANPPNKITVPPGQSIELDVQVTVPSGTPFGTSDSGFLQLVSADQIIYTAEFITFSHEEPPITQQLRLDWEYWNGAWTALAVRDETRNLASDGVVEFLAPPDFVSSPHFNQTAWWLRVRWQEGEYDLDPRIDRVLLNTTMASQTITLSNEVLGSSDSSANQTFQATRAPVLSGQRLQVREPEMPSGDDLDAMIREEGQDAVSTVLDPSGKPVEIWVRWHEVPDFYGSSLRSRHYTLDHLTGTLTFGDGLNGFIPPLGTANVRLALYKTGGGVRGNRPAKSIVQLKTTIPYIDKVINYEAATGGAEVETLDSLVSRAPTELRHRHRAVTVEDYQDLAKLASPDVARTLCVPNRDLTAPPEDQLLVLPGNVSVIIVPNTTDPNPQPSVELVRRVQDFISSHCPVTVNAVVVGPLYLRVDVQVEIGLASLDVAGGMLQTVQIALNKFLHPLTGGLSGEGWEFGREPHTSDIYALIAQIAGVDHIRSLLVDQIEQVPGTRSTGRFLVYSGNHKVTLVFEPS